MQSDPIEDQKLELGQDKLPIILNEHWAFAGALSQIASSLKLSLKSNRVPGEESYSP